MPGGAWRRARFSDRYEPDRAHTPIGTWPSDPGHDWIGAAAENATYKWSVHLLWRRRLFPHLMPWLVIPDDPIRMPGWGPRGECQNALDKEALCSSRYVGEHLFEDLRRQTACSLPRGIHDGSGKARRYGRDGVGAIAGPFLQDDVSRLPPDGKIGDVAVRPVKLVVDDAEFERAFGALPGRR